MRHLHIIDELKTGGAQTHLITMLREAVMHYGVEHHVISLFGDGDLSREIRALGVAVHVLDLRSHLERRQFMAASRELQILISQLQPDLVEAHLTWSRLLGLFAAWRAGVPLRIAFEHGDIYLDSWKFRIAHFLAQGFAHRIVVCSQALADWANHTNGIFRSKFFVRHNCVDLARFSRNGPKAGDLKFPQGTTTFCVVGTLGRGVDKRVDVCIRALAAARAADTNAVLVICGDGAQRSSLEQLATSLGVARHVRFLGTRTDVAAVLRCCNVFCHAAAFEPFGIVAIEAMSVGLAIIVPDSGGIREVVRDAVNGLVYPALDHRALAQAMIVLANDPGLRQSLGDNGHQLAQETFSVQQYVADLYRVYGADAYQCAGATVGASA
jgi:glycosyltransferase involved in cell wall biosynthesis